MQLGLSITRQVPSDWWSSILPVGTSNLVHVVGVVVVGLGSVL